MSASNEHRQSSPESSTPAPVQAPRPAPVSAPRPAPVPAIAFIGKSGSGKTTLTVKIIEELTKRRYRVGSIKHHGHKKFDIDKPGKDSWRHTQAGSVHTVIASPDMVASYRQLDHELEFSEIVQEMTDVDIVVVEGYRHGGVPSIELFRAGNPKDAERVNDPDLLDSSETIAVATDMPEICEVAQHKGLPSFDIDDAAEICDFIESRILGK